MVMVMFEEAELSTALGACLHIIAEMAKEGPATIEKHRLKMYALRAAAEKMGLEMGFDREALIRVYEAEARPSTAFVNFMRSNP
jgi:aspartate aminotransferase-like enzyme